jgi:hypothetical protein
MSARVESEATRLFRERPLETFWSPQGTVDIWRPAALILVTRVVGVLWEGGAAAIEAAVRRQVLEGDRHLGFHDWEEMTDYEPNSRTRLTTLGVTTLRSVEGAHFLLRSRVVTFGVQIANIIIKKLTVHPSREEFEQALTAALRIRGNDPALARKPTPVKRPPLSES